MSKHDDELTLLGWLLESHKSYNDDDKLSFILRMQRTFFAKGAKAQREADICWISLRGQRYLASDLPALEGSHAGSAMRRATVELNAAPLVKFEEG